MKIGQSLWIPTQEMFIHALKDATAMPPEMRWQIEPTCTFDEFYRRTRANTPLAIGKSDDLEFYENRDNKIAIQMTDNEPDITGTVKPFSVWQDTSTKWRYEFAPFDQLCEIEMKFGKDWSAISMGEELCNEEESLMLTRLVSLGISVHGRLDGAYRTLKETVVMYKKTKSWTIAVEYAPYWDIHPIIHFFKDHGPTGNYSASYDLHMPGDIMEAIANDDKMMEYLLLIGPMTFRDGVALEAMGKSEYQLRIDDAINLWTRRMSELGEDYVGVILNIWFQRQLIAIEHAALFRKYEFGNMNIQALMTIAGKRHMLSIALEENLRNPQKTHTGIEFDVMQFTGRALTAPKFKYPYPTQANLKGSVK